MVTMTRATMLEAACAVSLMIVGCIAVTWPSAIRRIGLRLALFISNPWSEYIRTEEYLRHTRIVGLAMISVALILFLAIYRRYIG